jgi:hypothetical protein
LESTRFKPTADTRAAGRRRINVMRKFKVETIRHEGGQYIPGTETEVYQGTDEAEAKRVFDATPETAIGSTYIADEDRWEIIWEK